MYVDVNLIQLVPKSIWTLKPHLCMNVCIEKTIFSEKKNKGVVHPRMKSIAFDLEFISCFEYKGRYFEGRR